MNATPPRARPARRPWSALVAALLVVALGAWTGRHLLDSASEPPRETLTALHAHADPVLPSPPQPARRVFVVVIDGLGEGTLAAMVARGALGPRVAWRARIDVGEPSFSRPVYHALLTGLPQSVAGIRNNAHVGAARGDGLPERVRAAGGRVAFALETVPWFHDLFGRPGDVYARGAEALSDAGLRRAYDAGAALTVLHFIQVDLMGHWHGATSSEYRAAAEQVAASVRALRAYAAARPGGARDAWFVGADHGHLARGGHGGDEMDVRRVSWFGLWDDAGAASEGGTEGSAGAVRAAFEVPGRVGVERLAPTFAALLGVQAPREALGEALPVQGYTAPAQPRLAARVSAVRAALERDAARARGGIAMRGAVLACLAALAVIVAVRARRWHGLAGAALVVLGACVGFALAGPGWTLSAIRTQGAYLSRALAAMGAGALFAWVPARRLGARISDVIALAALAPLSALALTLGTSGYAGVSNTALLLWPSAGLVPAAVALAAGLRWLGRALYDRIARPRASTAAPG